MMRILFASSDKYLPELRRAVEIKTRWLILRLIRRGVEVGVLAGLRDAGLIGFLANLRTKNYRRSYSRNFGVSYPVWRAISREDALYLLSMTAPDPVAIFRSARS